ncbi:MAG: chromosome segregation protein SMC [Clostridia bacterium]
MYFKRIEMHGFKSFAEPVVIDFHEGVTCIVGPNGSGKSNISDAIRWVLGEQSPKMLRGGKMEEVIFAGTASRKSRGMAEVTLVIDNSTGILDIDYNEVAITRRMYRSGESEYLINNNQCRLRDIKELIMDTGIGVDGYSIIGQGKIADIVSNKPESRREIFEEAAGVVMYKSKKAEAERKLEASNANLERVSDIVSEIEGRIDGLREDSAKAKEYLELRERYQDLEINITLKNIEKLETANDSIRGDARELTASIEKLGTRKQTLDGEISEERQKNERLEQLGNESNSALIAKIDELNQITNKSQLDGERLRAMERDAARINGEIAELESKLETEQENGETLSQKQEEIRVRLTNEEQRLQEKIQGYNEITARVLAQSEQVEEQRNEMFSLHSRAVSKRSEAASMESYRTSLQKRKEQLLAEGAEQEQSTRAFEADQKKDLAEQEAAAAHAQRIASAMEQLKQERADLMRMISEEAKKLDDTRIRVSQLAARKKTIEEMEHNYEGYNGAVRFVMKAGMPGIEGVVGDLMKAPAGYETALETALGGAMQNIVCQKDGHAKEAIRSLKANKAGRLTFLPMESVKGGGVTVPGQVRQHAGYLGIGAELAEFAPQYQGIFNYLLGRVAVVDNMDSAIALSKIAGNGIRFVTLDGEIINAGGAITGGRYKNASANLLARKSEIAALAEQVETLQQAYQKGMHQNQERQARQEEISDQLQKMEEERRQKELEISALQAKIAAQRQNFRDVEQAGTKREKELLSIEHDSADMEKMLDELLREIERSEAGHREAETQLTQTMQALELLKTEAAEASEEITKARIAKQDQENQFSASEELLRRVCAAAEELRGQIAERETRLADMDKEKHEILFSADNSEELFQKCSSEKAELEDYIARLNTEKASLTAALNAKTDEQAALGETLRAYQDQKYQQEIRLAKNETQLDTLKEKLWDEFEISYAQAMTFKKEEFVMSTATKESREIKNRIRELGDVNVGAIKEYEQVSERYGFLTEQRADILEAMQELQTIIGDMDRTIRTKFKENFDQVVIHFEEIFKELFGGGQAELRLDDENHPLEAGIEIIAQPPGKKLQNINLMSGGEKTMTAIALMFAVLKTKPTPFCILDEVEAALDDANIDRFANYLKNFHEIQFAVVTHQKATMEHADVLYGVTMPEQGISKVISLRLGDDFDL